MIKRLQVAQYVLIVAYVLILLFCSMGSICIDMGIQYIRAPDSGVSGPMTVDLDYDATGKIGIVVMAALELLLLHSPKVKMASLRIAVCVVRLFPSAVFGLLALLGVIDRGTMITVDVTVFAYLLLLLCMASLVVHVKHRDALLRAEQTPPQQQG